METFDSELVLSATFRLINAHSQEDTRVDQNGAESEQTQIAAQIDNETCFNKERTNWPLIAEEFVDLQSGAIFS